MGPNKYLKIKALSEKSSHSGIDSHVLLELSDPDHLFSVPVKNPDSQEIYEILGLSGIDYILEKIDYRSLKTRDEPFLITVPVSFYSPDFSQIMKERLNRYFRAKIQYNEYIISNNKKNAHISLIFGLSILSLCMATSALFISNYSPFPDFVNLVFGEGCMIIGWIMLWEPISASIFNPLKLKGENQMMKELTRIGFIFKPQTI